MSPHHHEPSQNDDQWATVVDHRRRRMLRWLTRGSLGLGAAAIVGKSTSRAAAAMCSNECRQLTTWTCHQTPSADGQSVPDGFADVTYTLYEHFQHGCDYDLNCGQTIEQDQYRPDLCMRTATPGGSPAAALATPAAPVATPVATPVGTATTVDVMLREYAIAMPTRLPAGETTFDIRNAGQTPHSFKITGPGIDVTLPLRLESGQSAAITLVLRPGRYDISCPLDNHADAGMRIQVTVTD